MVAIADPHQSMPPLMVAPERRNQARAPGTGTADAEGLLVADVVQRLGANRRTELLGDDEQDAAGHPGHTSRSGAEQMGLDPAVMTSPMTTAGKACRG